jgi:CCR4-NOT transcription complex subunit 1
MVEGDYIAEQDPRLMAARNATPLAPPPPLGEVVESSILGTKLTAAQSMEKFHEMISELDKVLPRLMVDSLAALPINHDVKMIIRQIPVIATQSANTDQTALAFSQKVVQLLYKSESSLGRDVYVTILQRLCDLFPKVAKEVTQWLIYAEDPRKYNVPVNVALIRAGLINVPEQDMQMAKIILRDFQPAAMDFAAQLVRECILCDTPCVSRNHFARTLEALVEAVSSHRRTDE